MTEHPSDGQHAGGAFLTVLLPAVATLLASTAVLVAGLSEPTRFRSADVTTSEILLPFVTDAPGRLLGPLGLPGGHGPVTMFIDP